MCTVYTTHTMRSRINKTHCRVYCFLFFLSVFFFSLLDFRNSATTTTVIHRPHGDSMLVIRPSVQKKNRPPSQHFTKNPVTAQASTITTTSTKLPNFTNTVLHLETAASTSTGKIFAYFSLVYFSSSTVFVLIAAC